MSTFKTKTNAAQITAKLLSTSALTTALLALAMNPARAQDVTVPDVTIPEAPSIETPAAPEAPAVNEGQSWTGFTDEEGSITVETPTTTFTDITQNTQLYVGTSANLDIPEGHHVNINQASSNYLFVAKAAPDADPTFILGNLTADGRVIIIDRNGVFHGPSPVIDVAGIIETTDNIDIADLRANEFDQYEITNITEGAINLNGTISVSDAGLAAFVAPSVSNAGVINATMGKVALASGETVTLDLYGDDLVEVAVPGNVADALVENSGSINANGGVVQITAAQAKDVVDNIINVSGIVDVSSVSTQGGKIVLSGGSSGKVAVSGTMNASGTNGGTIDVRGHDITIADTANLLNDGGENGNGGHSVVFADNLAIINGRMSAMGLADSGFIETSGSEMEFSETASITTTGEWLIDPTNITIENILATLLEIQLLFGNATVTTSGAGVQDGDITVTGSIDWLTNNSLTLNAHDDIFLAAGGQINSNGNGDFIANAAGDFSILAGSGGIDMNGGDIAINNGGIFSSAMVDSLETLTGTITLNQHVGGSIQNAIDAIDNHGTGQNTVNIGAGTFDETLSVSENNIWLKGAGQASTIIKPTSIASATALQHPAYFGAQNYKSIILAQNANNVDGTGLTVDASSLTGGAGSTNPGYVGISYYNAGGDVGTGGVANTAAPVTIIGGGQTTFGLLGTSDNTLPGHVARTVNVTGVTSSGSWWSALASIGNLLIMNITGGNYNGTGGAAALDLSNGSKGSVTNATLTTGNQYGENAGIVFHGGHDWTITNTNITGQGTASVGILDHGPAHGVGAASNISVVGGSITNVGTGIEAVAGGTNWDVNGTTITAASAGVGKGIHYAGLTGGNVNTITNVNVSNFAQGIHNDGSNGTLITGGTFTNNTTGTLVNPSSDVVIDGATYTGGTNGVVFSGGNNNTLKNSKVNTTTGDGVVVNGSTNAKIIKNEIGLLSAANGIGSGAGGGDAIFVTSGDGAVIQGNKTKNTNYNGPARKGSGILVTNSDNVTIGGLLAGEGNDIALAGSDGIVVRRDANLYGGGATADNNKIQGNTIHGAAGSRTGIYTADATNITIEKNNVSGSGRYAAIYVNQEYSTSSNATIKDNTVVNNEEQGIRIENTGGTNLIKGNLINDTGNALKASDGSNSGDAIYAKNVAGLTVENNVIGYTTLAHTASAGVNNVNGNGITILNSPSTQVKTNWITEATGHGIHINPSPNSLIQGNDIKIVDNHGINVAGGNTGVKVDDNDINGATLDGIHVELSNDIEITKNKIYGTSSYTGAGGSGIFVQNGLSGLIKDNEILGANGSGGFTGLKGANGDGIFVNNNDGVEIDNNTIKGGNGASPNGSHGGSGAGGHGIYVTNSQQARIVNNDILTGNNNNSSRRGGQGADKSGIYAVNNAGINTAGYRDGIFIDSNIINSTNSNVLSVGDDGIYVENSARFGNSASQAKVTNNQVRDTGEDGIDVRGTSGVIIDTNIVENVVEHGIRLNPSHNAIINNNTIWDTGLNGITVLSSNNVDVTNNKLHDLGQHGIYGETSNDLYVFNNTIGNGSAKGATVDGIHVSGGRNAEIDQNTIQGGFQLFSADYGAGRDGIHVVGNREAVITDNIIKSGPTFIIIPGGIGAVRHGIYVDNSGAIPTGGFDAFAAPFRDGVRITGNQILNNGLQFLGAGEDGIHVNNSAGGFFADRAIVGTNIVRGAGDDGIYVNNTDGIRVVDNNVSLAAVDGIRVENSDIVDIINNDVSLVGEDGIELLNSNIFDISENTVNLSGANGILATNVTLGTIDHNGVSLSGDNGISLLNGDIVDIDTNTVTLSGNDGISVIDSNLVDITNNNVSLSDRHGIFVDPSFFINITGNVVALSGTDGIHAEDTTVLNIQNNTVTLSGDDGIDVSTSTIVEVSDNNVTLSGDDGIAATNSTIIDIHNNTVALSGNDGISADLLNIFSIDDNIVTLSGDHGIELLSSNVGTVNGNNVSLSANDGIHAEAINLVGIDDNIVTLSGNDGIALRDSGLVTINNNNVTLSGQHGIFVDPSFGIDVSGNFVALSAVDGIHIEDVIGLNVADNIVTLSGDDGIDAQNVALFTINNNIVSLSGDDGVELSNAAVGNVNDNFITLSGDDGIDGDNLLLTGIDGNIVSLSGNNGIEVSDAAFTSVNNNFVTLSGNDGIHLDGGLFTDINGNFVSLSGDDGIDVDDTLFANILGNNVSLSGNNGIEVTDSPFVDIRFNAVTFSGNDGINVDGSLFADITNNFVAFALGDGIDVDDSWFADINDNLVTFVGGDGIEVTDSAFVDVIGNTILFTGDDGIDVRDSSFADLSDNGIFFTLGDGIQVRDSSFVQIDDNFIRFAGDDGIDFEEGFFSAITDNNIRFVGNNGVEINDSNFILVDGNTISDAADAGIFIDPSFVVFVTNNQVSNSDKGLYVQGPGNGYINVMGNTFTNNRVGARFESGIIDLTGIGPGGYGNKFIAGANGEVGIEFEDVSKSGQGLSLVDSDGGFTHDGTFDYQTWPTTTVPTNFGGTLGNQFFDGYSDPATQQYVTLGRNTFVDPGTGEAIWLDASNSTFAGTPFGTFSPAIDGLDAGKLAFLESMFSHRPDAADRGIFFFGALPDAIDLDESKFFEDFDPFAGGVSGLNVTITGLPRVSGFAPASGGAAGLNAIAPAAGDETTSADLANIEPAAGGEGGQNVSCWSDAVNAAGTGGPVNYSYGGTFEESIAAAATCGAQSF
ncbi:MAG: right-handed parallel beta-helix repeat-containing protein [Micavibrio sp.]|nr:right-handed parallel beta-helix repeat-containing protein [Micavibrio sp.]